MWGAKRSFPDLLLTTTVLATQSQRAQEADYSDAIRVLKYINQHKDQHIRLSVQGSVRVSVLVDSSCYTYSDTRGHGGYIITIGDCGYGGPIETNSGRSDNNAGSSMVYELYAFHKMLPSALLLHELLEELGYKQEPIVIFEDNKSLIDLIKRGKISTGVTKHIASKYYYATDLLKKGVVTIRHCPTKLMIADILTKPFSGKKFNEMSKRLRNEIEQSNELSNDVYARL